MRRREFSVFLVRGEKIFFFGASGFIDVGRRGCARAVLPFMDILRVVVRRRTKEKAQRVIFTSLE